VLCPTQQAAQRIAEGLQAAGLTAAFMTAGELDPGAPGVKTLTLQSAKGLEFPIVAVAGFCDAPYPDVPSGLGSEGHAALVQRERRTLFMAMTRATRALLVLVPAGTRSELLAGFDPACWNLGETRSA
jgi:superfamily I DNA/RNA helicase